MMTSHNISPLNGCIKPQYKGTLASRGLADKMFSKLNVIHNIKNDVAALGNILAVFSSHQAVH